jgi:5'-3' exonuclease
MNKMMLVDFNGIAIGTLMAVTKSQKDVNEDLVRHMILNSVIGYKKKFKCDDIIICADARSWRKTEFPHYKAGRQKGREKSPYDWTEVYRLFNMILD